MQVKEWLEGEGYQGPFSHPAKVALYLCERMMTQRAASMKKIKAIAVAMQV